MDDSAPRPGLPIAEASSAELALAADAFGEAVLILERGEPRLVGGDASFRACAKALGVAARPREVLQALTQTSAAMALEDLRLRGRSCAISIQTASEATLGIVGRATGEVAWLRLSIDGAGRSAAEAALDTLDLPVWLIGSDGAVSWGNRAWLALEQANPTPAPSSGDTAVAETVRQVLIDRSPRHIVRRMRSGDGRSALRTHVEPLGSGGAVAWTRDESLEQETGAALAQANALFDLALGLLSDGLAVFDRDHRLVRHNEAFARLWDLEPAWLAARPRQSVWLDVIRASGRAPENADLAAFRAAGLRRRDQLQEPIESLWRLPNARLLRVIGQPLADGGMLMAFADVTSQLELESQFNQLVKVQQATLDKLTDAVAVFGADARLKLHNDAFASFWRLPPTLLAAGPAFDEVVEYCVARVHDLQFWRDLKARIGDPDPALRAAQAGEAVTGDGRVVAWQSRPLPDGATLLGFSDVTDARQLQSALVAREAALEETSRLKRDFVGAVSRELRTPLTTVLGYAELLARSGLDVPAAQQSWVAAIGEASGALARLIDAILAVAQVDAGERRLSVSPVDLSRLLRAARDRWASRAKAAGVALEIEAGAEAGEIRADADALANVLDLLIERALDETPSGGAITLAASRAMGEAAISVADTGRGIPFDVQARIFERFTGLEGAGAGLGLSLIKGLVELHGGWVSVESEPGRGARFSCHLPEDPEAAEAPDLPAAEESGPMSTKQPSRS